MRNKKTLIIIAALCIVVGIIFWSKSKTVEKNYEVEASKVEIITVYDNVNQVKVISSDNDKIHITYYDKSSTQYTISLNGNELSISNKSKSDGNGVNAGINFSKTTLTIEIPKSFEGEFSATTFDNCDVDESINFSNVDVNSLSELLGE